MAKRKSSTYWARRKAQFIVEQMDDAERTAQTMNIVRQYAQERLEKQADKVFERYRLQFGLTEPEARRMLKKSGTSLEELDKLIMRSPKSEVLDNIMARRNAAAYAHRIEALKRTNAEVDALMRTLTKTDRQHTAKLLERVAKNAYANAVSLTGEQLGVDLGFRELDPKHVEELLKTNWMGGNYSKRIWKQNKALGETLKQEFMVNYLTGRSSHDMAQVLSERFGVSYFNSRRLVRTESTFVEAEMEARAYEDLDIEEYEYVSVLDNRTTILCQQHDGKVYKVKERKAGVNYPPLHPFCRATTIAHMAPDLISTGAASSLKDKQDAKFKRLFEGATDAKSMKTVGQNILERIDKGHIPVSVREINDTGFVKSAVGDDGVMEVSEYALKSTDVRDDRYKIKTAYHEAYHAADDGKLTDVYSGYFNDITWRAVEETFAETSAHYAMAMEGLQEHLTPTYSDYLIDTLPRLKKLDKFKDCESLADFGRIAWHDRLNGQGSVWADLANEMSAVSHDWREYGRQYNKYIKENANTLVDRHLELFAPDYKPYRARFTKELKSAIVKINKGSPLDHNETRLYKAALINAMNDVGVK